jgi:MFS transporter, Spinster family, sphingosine-1-phosphate transporter
VIRSPRFVLALLTALNLLNYLDRNVLSAVVAPVERDLGLSHFVTGLFPTIFLIGYTLTSPIFGHLGDRPGAFGRKGPIALGVAVWSAATVASGLCTGPWSMAASRAVVGVGEASYATIAPAIIDDLAPASRKGAWMSVFYAAVPIGSAFGYLIGGKVSDALGWRSAFFVAGGPGLAAALLCLLIADPARQGAGPPAPNPFAAAGVLARGPLYRGSVLGFCAYTFAIMGFGFWAPAYLHIQYGMLAGKAAFVFGLVTVLGGFIGTLVGGFVSDRAARARLRRQARAGTLPVDRAEDDAIARANLVVTAVSCAVGAPLAAAAISAPTASLFFALALPCQVALFALSGPINVVLLRTAPPALRASAMALSIFCIHWLGDLWSPPLIGLAADHVPMKLAMYAVPAVFALAAIVWWKAAHTHARLT